MMKIMQFQTVKILQRMLGKRITGIKISEQREEKKLFLKKTKNLNMLNIELN